MKKFIFAIAILISSSSFAEPNYSKDLNYGSNSGVDNAYESAKLVNWKSATNFKKATVVVNQQEITLFYNEIGDLVGSTSRQDFDKLPSRAVSTITSKYTFPEYTLTECIKFTNAEEEVKYYVSMKGLTHQLILEINEYGNTRIYSKTKN